MIGTSPRTRGGISKVVQGYALAGLFDHYPVSYISSHVDGSSVRKLGYGLAAILSILTKVFVRNRVLFHFHLASRASFWRKWLMIRLVQFTNHPYIIHLHGGRFMDFYNETSGPIAKAIIRKTFDRAALVITLSPEWKANISSLSKNSNIIVIPNGVPVPRAYLMPERTGSRLQLLFLGRLGKNKGIYDILEALGQIIKQHRNFQLVAAGDGDIDGVRRAVYRLGLEDNVVIPGWIDGEKRDALLKSSDIFLLPSYAEGMPMSLLEAMAAGLAVVSSPVGGIPLAVSDGNEGILVPPGNVFALREAILRLIRNPELRSKLGGRAYQRAKKDFSVDGQVTRLLEIYSEFGISPR